MQHSFFTSRLCLLWDLDVYRSIIRVSNFWNAQVPVGEETHPSAIFLKDAGVETTGGFFWGFLSWNPSMDYIVFQKEKNPIMRCLSHIVGKLVTGMSLQCCRPGKGPGIHGSGFWLNMCLFSDPKPVFFWMPLHKSAVLSMLQCSKYFYIYELIWPSQ